MPYFIYDVVKSKTLAKGANNLSFNVAIKKKVGPLEFYFKKYFLFFLYKSINSKKLKHKDYM